MKTRSVAGSLTHSGNPPTRRRDPQSSPDLPIRSSLPALLAALESRGTAVLQAPPGAGKTTAVPLALLEAAWRSGCILLLEPRRLAARAAARRMAALLGEDVGRTVGITTRIESVKGPETLIEVVTEGVLIRRLQQDPALQTVSAVIFDEFHERSLQADLGLALCLHSRALLRPELRLLVMSATLDGLPIASLLANAPVIRTEGRSHAVTVLHQAPAPEPGRVAAAAASAVKHTLAGQPGSLLVFLPGRREIDATARLLERQTDDFTRIFPLHGQLPPEIQDEAIRPVPRGMRKVVLATDIAETSLTIEGIDTVVDTGLARRPRFDPRSGLTRLETVRISRANAAQRCGRAGRLGPGTCIRLWSEADQARLPAQPVPEILEADLAPLALTLACWGAEVDELEWLDHPPSAPLAQARELLTRLGALDSGGRVTAHGQTMDALGMHPRLAHMLLGARTRRLGRTAALLAALLEERDPLDRAAAGSDLRTRLRALQSDPPAVGERIRQGTLARLRTQAQRWMHFLQCDPRELVDPDQAGLLLGLAYPDRIALRRPGPDPRFLLANGRGAFLRRDDDLSEMPCLVAAALDAGTREACIHLAAPLDREVLAREFGELMVQEDSVLWDEREQAVLARSEQRLGSLVLDSRPLSRPPPGESLRLLLEVLSRRGLEALPWTAESRALRNRIAFVRKLDGDDWPDMSDAALTGALTDWLGPWLDGLTRLSQLRNLDLQSVLLSWLGWSRQQQLNELAPSHITVPSGSRLVIDYADPDRPVLAVRIQEVFGWAETPRVGGGRVGLTLHLLSPARRPVQITQDLEGFWARGYAEVRKDLKGRYPKHFWPEDPLEAPACRGTRPGSAPRPPA